ncbi:hypothetical protein TrRE_jg6985 [Triparma retinervis]|uniref:Uncharacterized protein n=1 Tax=Triparma retinervis TaxID=2557542 RepID=A0A9W6ZF60_9STRA|nr:hypothetical protein TrRE_jg6985 [Triparma retinervis]
MSPTSPAGKGISVLAIVLSLLVIAFPVSVFTNLWKEELGSLSSRGSLEVREGEEEGEGSRMVGERNVDESFGFAGSGVRLVGGGGGGGGGGSKSSRVTFGNDVMDAVAMSREGGGLDGVVRAPRNPAEVGEEIRRLLGVIEEAKGEIERLTRSM